MTTTMNLGRRYSAFAALLTFALIASGCTGTENPSDTTGSSTGTGGSGNTGGSGGAGGVGGGNGNGNALDLEQRAGSCEIRWIAGGKSPSEKAWQ